MALTFKRKNKPPLWAMKLCCSHESHSPGATLATVTGSVRLMGTESLLAPCGGLSLRLAGRLWRVCSRSLQPPCG